MRRPTSDAIAFAWHGRALEHLGDAGHDARGQGIGNRAAIGRALADGFEIPDDPQCGWFVRRIVRDGAWVPVRIFLIATIDPDTHELCAPEETGCEVDGRRRNPIDEWPHVCTRPIAYPEFAYLCSVASWARAHSPNDPAANPDKPIDWLNVPLPVFKTKRKERP